jgi:hypothetical protein
MNRRLLGYLLINVLVSVAVIIIILILYDRFIRAAPPAPSPVSPSHSALEIAAVSGAGQIETETLTLRNTGAESLSLDSWSLKAATGATYTFPALTLQPGGSVSLHSAPGADTPSDLYWGLTDPVWQSGGLATLSDAQGTVEAVYRVP